MNAWTIFGFAGSDVSIAVDARAGSTPGDSEPKILWPVNL